MSERSIHAANNWPSLDPARPPNPMFIHLAWDAADLVVECLAQDLPRWSIEPDRERMHHAVFIAIMREMEA